MTDQEIDRAVREHGYVLPASVYISSRQLDHVRRDGEWIDIWSRDGRHWRVTVRPDQKGE